MAQRKKEIARRKRDRQTDKETDTETDRQTDRDRHTERWHKERDGCGAERPAGVPTATEATQSPLVDTDKCPSGIFSTTGQSLSVSC